MAVPCDPQNLLRLATPLTAVPIGMRWAALIGQFCQIPSAMATCDPQTIVANAKCIECGVPAGMQLAVLIALAANIAGVSPDPQNLINLATCMQCNIPDGMRLPILIYLACQIANK